ncbi:MAG: Rv2993c-like domain-containing protein, partial [Ktedonobacteraceae bacterium]
MKLVSFSTSATPQVRLGLVHNQEVVDVNLAARALKIRPCGSMQDLLDQQAESMPTLHAILEVIRGDPFSAVRTSGAVHALESVQLAAPLPLPRKNILCIGRNYHDHALESYQMRGQERPTDDAPVFFTKATTSMNTPYGNI